MMQLILSRSLQSLFLSFTVGPQHTTYDVRPKYFPCNICFPRAGFLARGSESLIFLNLNFTELVMPTSIEITALKTQGRLAAVHVKKLITILQRNTLPSTLKIKVNVEVNALLAVTLDSMYHIKVLCVSFVFTCYRNFQV